MVFLLLQSMKTFVCWVLRSHEIQGPHFMDFQCFNNLKSGVVLYLGIDWSETPAHLMTSSRQKLESN
jgi:hypothetical protein